MALEVKVTQGFLSLTGQLIAKLQADSIEFENMNLLLMKCPLVNTSNIQIVQGKYQKDTMYQAGLARVLAIPRLLDKGTDADVKVGDFVLFSHAAKYTISPLVVNLLFGIKLSENEPLDFVEENNQNPLITISDRDILAVIPERSITVSD